MSGNKSLVALAADINTHYVRANLARVKVGRMLNEARDRMSSNNAFGDWCREHLKSDLARSASERDRLMRVARVADAQGIDEETIGNLGWSGLVELAFKVGSDHMQPSEAQAASAAVVELAKQGRVTAAEVVQTINANAPQFAAARREAFEPPASAAPAPYVPPVVNEVYPTVTAPTVIKLASRRDALLMPLEDARNGFEHIEINGIAVDGRNYVRFKDGKPFVVASVSVEQAEEILAYAKANAPQTVVLNFSSPRKANRKTRAA